MIVLKEKYGFWVKLFGLVALIVSIEAIVISNASSTINKNAKILANASSCVSASNDNSTANIQSSDDSFSSVTINDSVLQDIEVIPVADKDSGLHYQVITATYESDGKTYKLFFQHEMLRNIDSRCPELVAVVPIS